MDRVEFCVGLFVEDPRTDSPLAPLTRPMVGVDALSQALTNPLLSRNVDNDDAFDRCGLGMVEETRRLEDLVTRSVRRPERRYAVTMTRSECSTAR